mgnify:CR=1 FL=1
MAQLIKENRERYIPVAPIPPNRFLPFKNVLKAYARDIAGPSKSANTRRKGEDNLVQYGLNGRLALDGNSRFY